MDQIISLLVDADEELLGVCLARCGLMHTVIELCMQ
jgi:hypothetical protein